MKAVNKHAGMTLVELLLVISVVIVLGVVVWFGVKPMFKVTDTKEAEPPAHPVAVTPQPSPAPAPPPPVDPVQQKDALKKERLQGIHDNLEGYQIAFNDYPAADAESWRGFLATVRSTESLTDPFTGTVYTFTAGDPDFGNIQYKYPASCNANRTDFVSGGNEQSYAFRLKFSDSIRCVDNGGA